MSLSFSGLDEAGWLTYPNRFICSKCEYGVSFSQSSLTHAASYKWKRERRTSKLEAGLSDLFDPFIESTVAQNLEGFALDFHCPKCSAAYTLILMDQEFHMASPRFRPLSVLALRNAE